ncbi:MAG: desulfoferrodoxin [Verrucomicrobia bacterium]|nr:desulfoferrodoxin [Verrucomicrobiota bacterium]
MTKQLEVYKCSVCGNMVEVIHENAGTLTCCSKAMILQSENTTDASKEKHVPVIEKLANGVKVSVGSVPHPMEAKHYIEWIELVYDNKVLLQLLKPGDAPAAFFEGVKADKVTAREYCNLHGLWKA